MSKRMGGREGYADLEKNHKITMIGRAIGVSLTSVKSSNLMAYGYDNTNNELWVLYKKYRLYKYPNITREQYLSLDSASSKGTWTSNNLRGLPCQEYSIEGL